MKNPVVLGLSLVIAILVLVWWFFMRSPTPSPLILEADTAQIAFFHRENNSTGFNLYLHALDATAPLQISQDFTSRKMQWLSAAEIALLDNAGQLRILNLNNGAWRVFRENVLDFAWSDAGNRVAIMENPSKLLILDALGNQIAEINEAIHSLSWSSNGQSLLYILEVAGDRDIHIMTADGEQRSAIPLDGQQAYPNRSPDGRFISYFDNVYSEQGGLMGRNLMLYELGTETVIDLESFVGEQVFPVWAADSQSLLFQQNATRQICQVGIDAQVLECYEVGSDAVWNADNKVIAYRPLASNGELCIDSLDVPLYGNDRCLLEWDGFVYPIAWRP